LDQTGQLLLEPPVESSRRLVEQQGARWLAPTRAASGHDDREGQPLALAAGEIPGIRAPHPLEPEEAKRRLAGLPRQLLVDALAYEEILGALRQESDVRGGRDAAPLELDQADAGAQERALPRPVPAHQRHPLAWLESQLGSSERLGSLLPLPQL